MTIIGAFTLTATLSVLLSTVAFAIILSMQNADISSQMVVLTGHRTRDWSTSNSYSMHASGEDRLTRLYVCMKSAGIVNPYDSESASIGEFRDKVKSRFDCGAESDGGWPRDYGFLRCIQNNFNADFQKSNVFLKCLDLTEGVMLETIQTPASTLFLGSFNFVTLLIASMGIMASFLLFTAGGFFADGGLKTQMMRVTEDGVQKWVPSGYNYVAASQGWAPLTALPMWLALAWSFFMFGCCMFYTFPSKNLWSDIVSTEGGSRTLPATPWTGYMCSGVSLAVTAYFASCLVEWYGDRSYRMNVLSNKKGVIQQAEDAAAAVINTADLAQRAAEAAAVAQRAAEEAAQAGAAVIYQTSYGKKMVSPASFAAAAAAAAARMVQPNGPAFRDVVNGMAAGSMPQRALPVIPVRFPDRNSPALVRRSVSTGGRTWDIGPASVQFPSPGRGISPAAFTVPNQSFRDTPAVGGLPFASQGTGGWVQPQGTGDFSQGGAAGIWGRPASSSGFGQNEPAAGVWGNPVQNANEGDRGLRMGLGVRYNPQLHYTDHTSSELTPLLNKAFALTWVFVDSLMFVGMLNGQNSLLNENVVAIWYYIIQCRGFQLAAAYFMDDVLFVDKTGSAVNIELNPDVFRGVLYSKFNLQAGGEGLNRYNEDMNSYIEPSKMKEGERVGLLIHAGIAVVCSHLASLWCMVIVLYHFVNAIDIPRSLNTANPTYPIQTAFVIFHMCMEVARHVTAFMVLIGKLDQKSYLTAIQVIYTLDWLIRYVFIISTIFTVPNYLGENNQKLYSYLLRA